MIPFPEYISLSKSIMGIATELYSKVNSDTRSSYLVLLCVTAFGFLFFIYSRRHKKDNFPTVNLYPKDWTLKQAHEAFIADAKGLILEGFRKVCSTASDSTYIQSR
jgi:hypothetical protein